MGEIADMMLDGTLCQGCGVYLGNDGYPGYCKACSAGETQRTPASEKVPCPHCGKRIAPVGLNQHITMKHHSE